MQSTPLLVFDAVSRRYGTQPAVVDLSFSIDRGEIVGLLGTNGAGKSTTLRMACGLMPPSSGHIAVTGHAVGTQPRARFRHIGYLPEEPPLFPDLTVQAYLLAAGVLRGLNRRTAAKAAAATMQRCDLLEVSNKRISRLSTGFRQRVGIAQAIVHDPDLVLLDEPTNGLDPVQLVAVRELISALGEHCGVIVSSHLLAEVQAVANRVLVMHEGRLLLDECLGGDSPRMLMTLSAPAPASAPPEIGGITGWQRISDHQVAFEPADGDVGGAVQQLCAAGLAPTELVAYRDRLEATFLQVATGTTR